MPCSAETDPLYDAGVKINTRQPLDTIESTYQQVRIRTVREQPQSLGYMQRQRRLGECYLKRKLDTIILGRRDLRTIPKVAVA